MFIIGEVMHVLGHGASGKFLYLPSNFAVTLKLLWKKKKKKKKSILPKWLHFVMLMTLSLLKTPLLLKGPSASFGLGS